MPITPELSLRMYLSTSSGVGRSINAATAPMCMIQHIAVDAQP